MAAVLFAVTGGIRCSLGSPALGLGRLPLRFTSGRIRTMIFGVHPLILVAAVGAVAALIAVVIACRARNEFVAGIALVLSVVFVVPAAYVFLAFHPEMADGRFRTRAGMEPEPLQGSWGPGVADPG